MKLYSPVSNGARVFVDKYEIVLDKVRGEIHIHDKLTRLFYESWPVGKVSTMIDLQTEVAYWERSRINA